MGSDFLIIGGGIAGISAAARLSELGSVTLLEQEAVLAHHASSRSAALYEPHYGKPAVVELSLASGEFYRGGEGLLSPRGLLLVSAAADEAVARDEAAAMALDPITPDEARGLVPILNDTVTFAAFGAHAWDIDTDLLIQTFLRRARSRGATVETGAGVRALARDSGGWTATTPKGAFSGRILVNAAGPWVDRVAALAGLAPIGFTPFRRSMARIPAPGGLDVSRWPMIFGADESWYAKPDAGALIVSPAEEDPAEPHDAWADDMVLAEGLARYEEMVREPVSRVLANWAGLRTFSPDRVPVIGFAPGHTDFFWLGGQGGYGFQTAPAASRLIADLIGGRPPEIDPALVAALSPSRFAG
ncbi:MAG: FAD-binding oxidoreductase [Paracoccaceae bacterium]